MPQLCTMLDSNVLFKVAFVRTVAPSVNSHRTAGSLACDGAGAVFDETLGLLSGERREKRLSSDVKYWVKTGNPAVPF
jgi:hypothetical protein